MVSSMGADVVGGDSIAGDTAGEQGGRQLARTPLEGARRVEGKRGCVRRPPSHTTTRYSTKIEEEAHFIEISLSYMINITPPE